MTRDDQDLLTDVDGDAWGPAEAVEPRLPARPGPKPEKAAPAPQSMIDLGPPPADSMAAERWAHQMLMRQAYETMRDPDLPQSTRRKEVRVILAAAAKHMTDAMRYDVAQLILAERKQLEDRKRARAAAKPEKRSPSAVGAKVIPIRRG